MKKKTKIWLIVLGVFVVIGLIGSLTGNKDKPQEIRVVTERSAAETEIPEPSFSMKPSATPKPSKAPKATETPVPDSDTTPEVVTLQPAEPEALAAPDHSAPADPEPTPEGRDYVLNTNTMKFHYPTCSSVKDIKDNNRKDVHATRESIIAQGYSPCGKCKP